MLPTTPNLSFTYFNVGGGDAIHIRFPCNDHQYHNILIDGGYSHTYRDVFGPLIRQISQEEQIDLWIITHIDLDHIGAALTFTQDKKTPNTVVHQYWFNHSPLSIKTSNGKLGVSQGINLRDYLHNQGLLTTEGITTLTPPTDFYGLKITILSPTPEKAQIADEHWQTKERSGKLGRTADQADHKIKFEALINTPFSEDTNPWNGSSIALLLEFEGTTALLLADSHPSIIAQSLKNLGYTPASPLQADFVQLSHHGSKANTSPELLSLINTRKFVITGNGITNRHPDKETLVRVLTRPNRSEDEQEFIFPAHTKELASIFATDEDVFSRYNFRCTYPEPGEQSKSIMFFTNYND